jgi:hypothetical protein
MSGLPAPGRSAPGRCRPGDILHGDCCHQDQLFLEPERECFYNWRRCASPTGASTKAIRREAVHQFIRLPNRRDFLQQIGGGLIASAAFARPAFARAAPAPEFGGAVVLDNSDPWFRGKANFANNLSIYKPSGALQARGSGLNICEEIGSPHRLAIDAKRSRIWVSENAGHRVLQYDLSGKERLSIENVQANALAVDPATSNVWILRSTGSINSGELEVLDSVGGLLVTFKNAAYDLALDGKDKALWLAGENLTKISLAGDVLVHKKISGWCSSSIAVDPGNGLIWVTTRQHGQGGGQNELLGFDRDGKNLHTIPLDTRMPFRVAADPLTGTVWVANWKKTLLQFSKDGKLQAEHDIPALAVDVETESSNIWVVTPEEVLKLNKKAEVMARARHVNKTTQAWIACL